MDKALRFVVAVPSALFAISGIRWIVQPGEAAAALGMSLPEGIARSTMIGDVGGFFLALSAMIGIGVFRLKRAWLHCAAILLGGAAFMRILAWAVHDAAFATQFIVAELLITAILIFGGNRITARP